MDNELFDLCKQVYEKTDFKGGNLRWWISNKQTVEGEVRTAVNSICPLYTSEYLVDKIHASKDVRTFQVGFSKSKTFYAMA